MQSQIYRYKLDHSILEHIIEFAKYHQYDDRKTYKEYWEKWCEEYSDMIENETNRLVSLGYKGSVIDKMYKAGRYYFRKKYGMNHKIGEIEDKDKEKEKEKNKKEDKKRQYITIEHLIIVSIDNHIKDCIENKDYKPSSGFENYYKSNEELLNREIQRLQEHFNLNENDIYLKIKKTYKNRYYLISHK